MKGKVRVLLALSLAGAVASATMTGFSSSRPLASTTLKDNNKTETLTVFSSLANYQGEMTGWGAKILKDALNVKINLISPNVAGGGDTLYQTRAMAGDLGDVVILSQDKVDKTIKSGLFYDMNSKNLLSTYGKNLTKYPKAMKKFQDTYKTGSHVYVMPDSVSSLKATDPSTTTVMMNALYTRWDYYTKIGSPKLNSMNDVMKMLNTMQNKFPKGNDGKKTYAISLFKDWDGSFLNECQDLGTFYGWTTQDVVEYNADARKVRSILDSNSYYMQMLKFYNQCQQKGLVDPDSPTQDWATVSDKYGKGDILFGGRIYMGMTEYNSADHKNAGQGFEVVPLKGEKLIVGGCNPYGGTNAIGIGSKCKNVARALKFINWLYSPDGTNAYINGMKGLQYTTQKNGKNKATTFGKNIIGETKIPAQYGGGTFNDGNMSNLNWTALNMSDIDPKTHEPYVGMLWSSNVDASKLNISYTKAYNAKYIYDYLKKNNQVVVQPGNNYVHLAQGDDIKTTLNLVGSVIKQYSWKMLYASSASEFDSLYSQMVSQANGLGISKVIAFDKKDIAGLNKAFIAATK